MFTRIALPLVVTIYILLHTEIADWVIDISPKPGVAFGSIKTGNPLCLITSCCGTAIERISAFSEFYLKPLANELPSFLKDTTDLINKINELNVRGPPPSGYSFGFLGRGGHVSDVLKY